MLGNRWWCFSGDYFGMLSKFLDRLSMPLRQIVFEVFLMLTF